LLGKHGIKGKIRGGIAVVKIHPFPSLSSEGIIGVPEFIGMWQSMHAYAAMNRHPGGGNNFYRPDIQVYGFCWSQFDFAEYNRDRKIEGSFHFCPR
jgi:hypothetical protein